LHLVKLLELELIIQHIILCLLVLEHSKLLIK
jgi:hypothetical protein